MDNKKVLTVLLGSPRKGGNSEALAAALARGAEENGCEVRYVRLAELSIRGCLDCRKCWSYGVPCVQSDDMPKVYKDICDADVIVFASPLYYYSWTSYIKAAWDRLLPFFMPNAPQSLKGKRVFLISAAGDTSENCFDGIRASYRLSCAFCGWKSEGEICAGGLYAKTDAAKLGTKYINAAYNAGKGL
ncbi:MAG: flavodoxin family protein [Synergistes sp.]|nr:flavodoxin family protein [Synergistes sp.]